MLLLSLLLGILYLPLYLISWILFIAWNFIVLKHMTELPFFTQPEIFIGLLSSIMIGGVVRGMFGKEDMTYQGFIKKD